MCQEYEMENIALLFGPCGVPLEKKNHFQCLQISASNFFSDSLFLYVAPLITRDAAAVTLRYSATAIARQSLAAAALTCWALMEVTASLFMAVQLAAFAFCTYT